LIPQIVNLVNSLFGKTLIWQVLIFIQRFIWWIVIRSIFSALFHFCLFSNWKAGNIIWKGNCTMLLQFLWNYLFYMIAVHTNYVKVIQSNVMVGFLNFCIIFAISCGHCLSCKLHVFHWTRDVRQHGTSYSVRTAWSPVKTLNSDFYFVITKNSLSWHHCKNSWLRKSTTNRSSSKSQLYVK